MCAFSPRPPALSLTRRPLRCSDPTHMVQSGRTRWNGIRGRLGFGAVSIHPGVVVSAPSLSSPSRPPPPSSARAPRRPFREPPPGYLSVTRLLRPRQPRPPASPGNSVSKSGWSVVSRVCVLMCPLVLRLFSRPTLTPHNPLPPARRTSAGAPIAGRRSQRRNLHQDTQRCGGRNSHRQPAPALKSTLHLARQGSPNTYPAGITAALARSRPCSISCFQPLLSRLPCLPFFAPCIALTSALSPLEVIWHAGFSPSPASPKSNHQD